MQAIARQISGIRVIAGVVGVGNGTVTFGDKHQQLATCRAFPTSFSRSRKTCRSTWAAGSIRWIFDEVRKIVVIGTSVAERLFATGGVDPVGQDVRVKDVVMKVVGVFHDKGNRGRASESAVHAAVDRAEDLRRWRAHRFDHAAPGYGADGLALEQKSSNY